MNLEALQLAIGHGPENGTSVPRLMALFEEDDRTIRQGLDDLAESGVLIVTIPRPGGKSVYIARTEEEFQAGIDHLIGKRDSTSVRIARMEETKRVKFGPPKPKQLRMAV